MTLPALRTPSRASIAMAVLLAAVAAFLVYRATMLPGFDFGDTAGFQDKGGEATLTPRQGYPLYFAIGWLFVHAIGGEPAIGMNLSSVVCGAIACGLITWLAVVLSESLAGGLLAGLLVASSYTFWSQAIIAEVYTLHLVMLSWSLLSLLWWGRRPQSLARLGVFFGVYALGFGNHLMMILLAPAAAVYVATRIPGGVRGLLAPRVVLLALVLAALGSLQYLWNLAALYAMPVPPESMGEALRTFWFDVTKSDWRAAMVVGIDRSAYAPRVGMYWFDVTQQFGVAPVVLAVAGVVALAATRWREALLVVLAWIVAVAFAYTYNVGDAHVFYLPSHLCVALAAGCGLASVGRVVARLPRVSATAVAGAAMALALAYPAWRTYDTWPAVDRSMDRRPLEYVRRLARDLDPRDRVLVADLNWQLQNGLDYYTQHLATDVVQVRGGDRVATLPWLVRDNLAIGRDVVVLPETRRLLETAYGDLLPMDDDPAVRSTPLDERVSALPDGTPYVLALLKPYDDLPFDREELARTVRGLSGGTATIDPGGVYTIVAGLKGQAPSIRRADRRPYRLRARLAGIALDLRMESWLPADTMRRAGFGHVIANRRHALILERGVSFVALNGDGSPRVAAYASGLFAPLPRYRITPAAAGPKG
jgi:hypothetical protein